MSVYCFDTDVLSATLWQRPPASLIRRLAHVSPEDQATTSITVARTGSSRPDGPVVAVDPRAVTGFGSSAAAYDRARPSYPDAAVARVTGELGVGKESVVLDLAAGTGKLTRALERVACRVIAVEPSGEMRALLSRSASGVQVLAGTAESLPVPDGSIDAVLVGEAFHWFRTAEAGVEIARVLRPAGGLGLLWNRPNWSEEANPWLPAMRELLDPYREAAGPWPGARGHWEPVLADTGRFDPPVRGEVENLQRLSADDFVVLVSSWSWIANLRRSERGAVLARVRGLVGSQAEIALHYVTETYTMRRR